MIRAKASGHTLTNHDASIVMGMISRGDRDHDIAAWFGVNQGRIAEVKEGKYGSTVTAAPAAELPPKGAPGVKGKKLREAVSKIVGTWGNKTPDQLLNELEEAAARFDANQA
jgi:hypothetical protein